MSFDKKISAVIYPKLRTASAVKISGIRVSFEIEKTESVASNKADVRLFNLSQETRNFLGEADMMLNLYAGYGNSVSMIFSGDISKVISSRSGADIITSVSVADGMAVLSKSRVNFTLSKNSSTHDAIDQCIKSLGVGKGFISLPPEKKYPRGYSFAGSSTFLLENILKPEGYKFSIQNNKIQITKSFAGKGNERVIKLGPGHLLTTPALDKKQITVATFLQPGFSPGQLVEVHSKMLGKEVKNLGYFSITKSGHKADTGSKVFFSKFTAEAVKNLVKQ